MRLTQIRKLCLKTRTIVLFDGADGTQWLCNGFAAWPVDGLRLTEAALPVLFNLSDKQMRDMNIRQADQFDARWSLTRVIDEEVLTELGTVWWADALYTALRSEAGVMLVLADWFKPSQPKDGELEYYARWKDGRPLIAVYGDLLCAGLATPVSDAEADMILAAPRTIARATPFRWPSEEKAGADAAADAIAGQMGLEDVAGAEGETEGEA